MPEVNTIPNMIEEDKVDKMGEVTIDFWHKIGEQEENLVSSTPPEVME